MSAQSDIHGSLVEANEISTLHWDDELQADSVTFRPCIKFLGCEHDVVDGLPIDARDHHAAPQFCRCRGTPSVNFGHQQSLRAEQPDALGQFWRQRLHRGADLVADEFGVEERFLRDLAYGYAPLCSSSLNLKNEVALISCGPK